MNLFKKSNNATTEEASFNEDMASSDSPSSFTKTKIKKEKLVGTEVYVDRQKGNKKNYITVDRKKLAVGIFWQPFVDVRNQQKEIKSVAKKLKTSKINLFCIKTNGVFQYGLASSLNGYKANTIVAAPFVASALGDRASSLTMFKVPEGWWMLVIRNDIILPDEDLLFDNEEEAKKAYGAMLAVPDWGYKIAPANWRIEGAEERQIKDLIDPYSTYKLKNIGSNKNFLFIIIVIISIIALGGYQEYKSTYLKKAQEQMQAGLKAKQIAIEKQKQIEIEKKKVEIQKKLDAIIPWKQSYNAMVVFDRCQNTLKKVYIPFAGWDLSSVSCSKSQAQISWKKKDYGRKEWIGRALKAGYLPDGIEITSLDDKSVTGVVRYTDIESFTSEPQTSITEIKKQLKSFFELNKIQNTIGESSKDFKFGEAELAVSKSFKYVSFSMTTSEGFSSYTDFLSSFGGLVIDSIDWDLTKRQWVYKGEIYGK